MMRQAKKITVSQPEDWLEAFQRQASIEGMSFSKWVGLACLKALPFSDESEWTPEKAIEAHGLSPRAGRGRPVPREVAI